MAINYNQNKKAFLSGFPLKKMKGHQKFLALAAYLCRGRKSVLINISEIRDNWKKSILGGMYNSSYYHRAEKEGWVDSRGRGTCVLTPSGETQLQALVEQENIISSGELRQSGSLILVNRKGTHTFDKWLRGIFSGAKRQVLVADSYVDDSIFDNLLDIISKSVSIKLLYGKAYGTFKPRSNRFSTEYIKYEVKGYKKFHDRFLICDGVGYFLGPSLKDAASNYPATVVRLKSSETQMLENFFRELWKNA